jgi:hypothetical protein
MQRAEPLKAAAAADDGEIQTPHARLKISLNKKG